VKAILKEVSMSDLQQSAPPFEYLGIAIVWLITAILVCLKLYGKIAWPWVWVLSPAWIQAALVVFVWVAFAIFMRTWD